MPRRRKPFNPLLNWDDFLKKIEENKFELTRTDFFNKLCDQLDKCLEILKVAHISEMLCYGLGNFTSSITSRYQLGLLLLLKNKLNALVYIYDPLFTDDEKKLVKKLELNLLTRNDVGNREINKTTLVFMPHCPTGIVNNLLWRNWGTSLSNCVILSNSFKTLSEIYLNRILKINYYYIYSILHTVVECPIDNCFRFTDIFNDMSYHVFPKPSIDEHPKEFWLNNCVPVYADNEKDLIIHNI